MTTYILTVTQPFGDYEVGQQITDAKVVEGILASSQALFVVKTAAPEPDAPDLDPAEADPNAPKDSAGKSGSAA